MTYVQRGKNVENGEKMVSLKSRGGILIGVQRVQVLFGELWLRVDEINGDRLEVIFFGKFWLSSFFILSSIDGRGKSDESSCQRMKMNHELQNNIHHECRHFIV